MAAPIPVFGLSPNTILSFLGLLYGKDPTEPTPSEDWKKMTVDVVIPAHNEEATIVMCLESLRRQTIKPRRVVLMDDGSHDRTHDLGMRYGAEHGMPVVSMRSEHSVGKTPGIKRNARELDGDVIFVLDGDTILVSPEYIERCVFELFQARGVASVCGGVTPLRLVDRHQWADLPPVKAFYDQHEDLPFVKQHSRFSWLLHGITNIYRDFLYFYLRTFISRGQMVFFGSVVNPVGCAVAYRRNYIRDLFDHYEPSMGDDLTTSEDIFIGFALLERGYRNVQIDGVYALTEEPFAHRLPHQVYLWSSSFLQSCYYFPGLVLSPFKSIRRTEARRLEYAPGGVAEKRKIKEPYRQAFGLEQAKRLGRPMGWAVLFGLIEKITFAAFLWWMIATLNWRILGWTVGIEVGLMFTITLVLAAIYRRPDCIWKMLVTTPVRYFIAVFEMPIFLSFLFDVCVLKDFKWRK